MNAGETRVYSWGACMQAERSVRGLGRAVGRHLERLHGALGHGRSTPTRAPVGEIEDMQEYVRFRPGPLRLHVRHEPTYSGCTIAATSVHCARATGTCEGSKRG